MGWQHLSWIFWLAVPGAVHLRAETPCPGCEAGAAAEAAAVTPVSSPQIQSVWTEAGLRTPVIAEGTVLENQVRGKVDLAKLAKPLVVSFVYTRCQNPRKCPRVSSAMVELAGLVSAKGLSNRVCLALITYDPEFDTPAVMLAYGQKLNMPFGKDFMMLRPGAEQKQDLFGKLGIGVNFDRRGDVNVHANQLLVIDAHGRLARKYEVLLWKNQEVLVDIEKLLAETPPAAGQPAERSNSPSTASGNPEEP